MLTLYVRLCLCLSLSPSLFIDFGRSNNVVAQRVHSFRPHTHTHTLRHAQRTVTLFLIHSSGRHTASIARTNKSSGLLRTTLLCSVCVSALFPLVPGPAAVHYSSVSLGLSPCSDFSCHIFRARQGATAERGMTKIINNLQRKRHVATCRWQRILTVPHADQRNPLYHVHSIHTASTHCSQWTHRYQSDCQRESHRLSVKLLLRSSCSSRGKKEDTVPIKLCVCKEVKGP